MERELFKELKYSGFPLRKECYECGEGYAVDTGPTLSELLQDCGDDFFSLEYSQDEWTALSKVESDNGCHRRTGKTPEEAVARLWLALKKKDGN